EQADLAQAGATIDAGQHEAVTRIERELLPVDAVGHARHRRPRTEPGQIAGGAHQSIIQDNSQRRVERLESLIKLGLTDEQSRRSSSIVSSTHSAAAHASGLPPKVEA